MLETFPFNPEFAMHVENLTKKYKLNSTRFVVVLGMIEFFG